MKEMLSFSDREIRDPYIPVSSLHLLVPPLQLFSAAMWQVLQQQRLLHYGKLKEFVSLVMEMFPDLLSESQRTELTLGLQHMGPAGCKTDPAVETLLWEFLSRLGEMLLVPDLKQTVSWLHAAPSVLEVCVQSDSCIDQLRTLLRPHRSCQQMDKNETHPSLEECKLDCMALSPSQQVLDSIILTNTNSQSHSIADCINCLNPTTSGQVIKTESVMDSSDCTGAEPQSVLNRCEDTEDRIQRKTGYLTNRLQKNILINMKKEEEDGESQSLEIIREDERYKGYKKEEEKQMEGNTICQATQTDKQVQKRDHSEQGQQEGDDLFSLVTFCLLKQPKVLIRRLENCSISVPVSSPPHSMVTPLRGNGLVRLKKDQVLTQKSKTISQSKRPMQLLPFSSEIRTGAEVSLGSLVILSREQNTGQTVEEASQVFASSQCPVVHTEEVNLHQHIEKVHTERLSWSLGSQKSPSRTHQHPSPPKTFPTPTQSHTGTPGTHTCSQCGKSFPQLGNLKKHLRTHTGERPYPCSQCGKSFAQSCHLKRHLRTHTGECPYPCSHCGKSFARFCTLKDHLRTHTGERPYPCSHCAKSFAHFSHLTEHLRTHTGEHPYPCSHCGKSFAHSCSLKNHLRTHTGERPYPCSQCGKSFTRSWHLKRHLRTHTGKCPYPCSHCGKSFARFSHLTEHLRTHAGERLYPCSHCGKNFDLLDSLTQHQRTHTGERPYPCSHCGKSFRNSNNLKVHLRTHTGERPYSCSHCGKSLTQLGHLQKHLRTHTGERPYPCSHCGKSFTQSCALKKHLQTHTRERPYPCSHCGKSFARFSHLTEHLRTHAGERLYPCSHCGKNFDLLDSLTQHQRTHTGERPYPCSHCGKSFRNSNNLKVHLRTHTGERPYPCSHCGKSFTQSCALKKHLQTHTRERPYPCSQCGKSFTQSCALKKHLQTHTRERPYPCSQCGKSFSQLDNLKKHLQTHTGEQPYSVERVLATQIL